MSGHPKVERFDRPTVHLISEQIDAAIQEMAQRLGVAVSVKGARYRPSNMTVRVELSLLDAKGQARSPEVEAWQRVATMRGLKVEMLGQAFSFNGKEYRLTGWSSGSSKYPVLADRVTDGRKFKLPERVLNTFPKTTD